MSALCWASHLTMGCCRLPPTLTTPLSPNCLRTLYCFHRRSHCSEPPSLTRELAGLTLARFDYYTPLLNRSEQSFQRRFLTTSASTRQREQVWNIMDRDVVVRTPDNEGYAELDILKRPCYPMMKNMFCARFISEVLEFPEVLSKIQMEELEAKLDSLGYSNGQWKEQPSLETLAGNGFLGAEVPERFGGLSYTMTENVRLMEAAAITNHAPVVISQNLFTQILLAHGSEQLQTEWLPRLVSGSVFGSVCTAESTGTSDLAAVRSEVRYPSARASLSPDSPLASALKSADNNSKNDLRLSGEKVAVLAASNARLFLVTANVYQTTSEDEEVEPSVFLVDREAGGVTVTACPHRPGLYTVRFDNTPVSHSNLIGDIGAAYSIFLAPYSNSRVLVATQTAAMLRQLLDSLMQHCIHRESFGRHMSDFCLPRYRLASMAAQLYSLESMVYVAAGIHDLSEIPDYTLEAAACHVTACQVARDVLEVAGRLLGTIGQTRSGEKGQLLDRCSNLAAIFSRHTASEEMTKMFITLEGLKFASKFHSHDVEIWRDPVENPLDSVKRTFRKVIRRRGRYKYDVDSFLHPSLESEAEILETMMGLFNDSLSQTLVHHGNEMMNQQTVLVWLSDAINAIFRNCATLARASRSYCIGLQDAQTEINIARAELRDSHDTAERLYKYVVDSPVLSPDRYYLDAADRLVETTRSGSSHPLTRLF